MKRWKIFVILLILLSLSCYVAIADDESSWSCPDCGALNTTDFCTKCGRKRPENIVCSGCGKVYSSDTDIAYCGFCGTKLSVNNNEATENKETIAYELYNLYDDGSDVLGYLSFSFQGVEFELNVGKLDNGQKVITAGCWVPGEDELSWNFYPDEDLLSKGVAIIGNNENKGARGMFVSDDPSILKILIDSNFDGKMDIQVQYNANTCELSGGLIPESKTLSVINWKKQSAASTPDDDSEEEPRVNRDEILEIPTSQPIRVIHSSHDKALGKPSVIIRFTDNSNLAITRSMECYLVVQSGGFFTTLVKDGEAFEYGRYIYVVHTNHNNIGHFYVEVYNAEK